jgi:transcription initiation factor IIE alpha subunit
MFAETLAILDESSTVTLIDDRLALEIGLKYRYIKIILKRLNDQKIISNSERVKFGIHTAFDKHEIISAFTMKNLKFPSQLVTKHLIYNLKYDSERILLKNI